MVQELLNGITLKQGMTSTGPLDLATILVLAQSLGEALMVIHAGGLVHCDIKPDNLFWTNEQRFVLIDFGLACKFEIFAASILLMFMSCFTLRHWGRLRTRKVDESAVVPRGSRPVAASILQGPYGIHGTVGQVDCGQALQRGPTPSSHESIATGGIKPVLGRWYRVATKA